jgi:hypothetical protein
MGSGGRGKAVGPAHCSSVAGSKQPSRCTCTSALGRLRRATPNAEFPSACDNAALPLIVSTHASLGGLPGRTRLFGGDPPMPSPMREDPAVPFGLPLHPKMPMYCRYLHNLNACVAVDFQYLAPSGPRHQQLRSRRSARADHMARRRSRPSGLEVGKYARAVAGHPQTIT